MNAKFDDHSIPCISDKFRFQWEEKQNRYVLLFPEGMIKLNQTAGEILKLCNNENTVHTIIGTLVKQYQGMPIKEEIYNFLGEAYDKGWLKQR